MPKPVLFKFDGVRITIHTDNSFSTVMSKLYSSIGSPESLMLPEVKMGMFSANDPSRLAKVKSALGPHDFMLYQETDHGSRIQMFGFGTGLGLKRLIFGNPHIARAMMDYDSAAALAAPIETLVMEKDPKDGGGTDLVYNLPSSLVAGCNPGKNKPLVRAAEILDEKLLTLMEFVAS